MGIAYLDLDGDGQLDPMVDAWVTDNSEETVAPEDNRTLIYIHPTGWEATWYTSFMGGAGWSVFTEGPYQYEAPPIPVPWSEGLVLGRN